MDKSKNTLSKSKSSNGTTAGNLRQKRNDKKSRSNAEIKPLALKKRGVYVEKKPTKTSLNGPRMYLLYLYIITIIAITRSLIKT